MVATRPLIVLLLLLGLGSATATTRAQTPTTEPTAERLENRLAELAQAPELSEETRTRLTELYQGVKRQLATAQEHATKRAELQRLPDTLPQQLQKLRAGQEKLERERHDPGAFRLDPSASGAALEAQLAAQQTELAAIKSRQDQLKHDKEAIGRRPIEAKEQLSEAKHRVEEIEQSLVQPDPADLNPLIAEAQRLLLKARLLARKSEIQMLDQEVAVNSLRASLVGAELELADRQVATLSDRVNRLQAALAERRRTEAETLRREAEQAVREATGKSPAIRTLTQQNADWGRNLTEAVAGQALAAKERETIRQQSLQIAADFSLAQQKLKVASLSDALGQVLRDQRMKLPDRRQYRKRAREREEAIGILGLEKIQIEERLEQLQAPEQELNRLIATEPGAEAPSLLPEAEKAELKRLLEDQKRLLEDLNRTYGGYLRQLVELDFEQQQILKDAEAYAGFLDERLLWIRSARPLGLGTLPDLLSSLGWLLSPARWIDTATLLARALIDSALVSLLVALALGVLLRKGPELVAAEEAMTREIRRISSDRFSLTLKAAAYALLRALTIPLVLGYLGWQLQTAPDGGEFPRAVGAGLSASAVALLILLGLRRLFRAGGVCEAHFNWNPQMLRLLRGQIGWLAAVVVPLLFLNVMIGAQADVSRQNSLGRLIAILGLGLLTLFLYRLFWSGNGFVALIKHARPQGWAARLTILWGGGAVAMPVLAVGLSAAGYHYSAVAIMEALRQTARLAIAIFLLRALVLRWFLVHRRRFAMTQAMRRREALHQPDKEAITPQGTEVPHLEVPEESPIDLSKVDEQTRRLVNTLLGWSSVVGVYLIWGDFLPALRILDDTALWHYAVKVEGQERVASFTLLDLGLVAVIATLTAAAARNLPGILEVVLLERLPITTGGRYATKTILQYLIVAAGLIYTFQILGASWSQVQWLVAALGVGLGFGLQEIFANFISGLIILFERPIRVGDTITVGDVTGVVSRVRIRATTIRDWDRKELIVPNKSFITERVINWTLSDPITRVVIRIGVAYGTDTERARELVMELVRQNPLVLADPAPTLYFEQFGDSSLNLVLRVYVQELEHRLPVIHELHTAINQGFERAGIRIPYPQRDLHLFHGESADPRGRRRPL